MPDVFCGNTDKCQMCPKSVENAVFHVFHKQGFHIPVIRSEFNFMLFILKGEILVNSEEYAGTTVKTGEFILQPITASITYHHQLLAHVCFLLILLVTVRFIA